MRNLIGGKHNKNELCKLTNERRIPEIPTENYIVAVVFTVICLWNITWGFAQLFSKQNKNITFENVLDIKNEY